MARRLGLSEDLARTPKNIREEGEAFLKRAFSHHISRTSVSGAQGHLFDVRREGIDSSNMGSNVVKKKSNCTGPQFGITVATD